LRQTAIEDAFGTKRQLRQNPAIGVDDRGNPRVRGPDQGQSFLNRAQPRLREMLMGAGHPIPSIVRHIEEQAWTVRRWPGGHDLARENRLIANQRRDGRQSGNNQQSPLGTRREPARDIHELTQAQTIENVPKRQIFAEGHKMHLIVAFQNMPAAGNHLDGVEIGRFARR
jgi:hypothetical protein